MLAAVVEFFSFVLVLGNFFCCLFFFTEKPIHLYRSPFVFTIYTASLSEASIAPLSLSSHHQLSSSSFSSYLLASSLHWIHSATGMIKFQQNSRPFHASPDKAVFNCLPPFHYIAHAAGPWAWIIPIFPSPAPLQDTFGEGV